MAKVKLSIVCCIVCFTYTGFSLQMNKLWSNKLVKGSLDTTTVSCQSFTSTEEVKTLPPSQPMSARTALSRQVSKGFQVGILGSMVALSSLSPFPFIPVAHAEEGEENTFKTTDSGLKYKDTKLGDGNSPAPGDTVRVHYTGWLEDFESEKKFDSSYDRRKPLVFKVGVKQVIAGWDEGLLTDMKVGGQRELIIPPQLGYGARGAGGVIPPNSTLYFKIELVGIGAR